MDLVLRATFVYVFVFIVLRASGKRQFSDLSTFDFVLLLIVSEAISNAINSGEDFSLTAAVIIVATIVLIDILLSVIQQHFPKADAVLEGVPVLLVDNGRMLEKNMRMERVGEADILTSARINHGIASFDKIKYAILERDGVISIIPSEQASGRPDREDNNVSP